MKILGIETSCDETSASIIKGSRIDRTVKLISNIISSSVKIHAKTGGIIPEKAAREQVKFIIPVIQEAFEQAFGSQFDTFPIDAIAVTFGPGLIGSLLVGVETAKTLAYIWNKPIVPVNHLIGHIYANWISTMNHQPSTINFPALALLVSGGHTDLLLMKQHGIFIWLGGTRDDAAGEALDKIGRLLGLSYPAGAMIEQLAMQGNPKAYNFPRPLIDSNDFDFSFSGLKTAVKRFVILRPKAEESLADLCASVQQVIIDVLVKKTLKAAQIYKVKSILLGGGVAANEKLKIELKSSIINNKLSIKFFAPPKNLCTDNAAMIAAAAFYNYKPIPWHKITANPELHFN